MAKREAERKALQRAGYRHRQIMVHDGTLTAALLAAGLITDAQLEDDAAINEAAGRLLMKHCKVARLLEDKTPQPDPNLTTRPKTKRGIRWKKGLKGFLQAGKPVSGWTAEDTEAWESGKTRPHAFHWRPSYSGYINGDPLPMRCWPPGSPPKASSLDGERRCISDAHSRNSTIPVRAWSSGKKRRP